MFGKELVKHMLHIILPIFVGAVIGYCTNYIAIKMLFHPGKEVRLGNFRLPFTPGVIPKNQPRIAKAVATAVSEQLLTGSDISKQIAESNADGKLAGSIAEKLINSELTIKSFGNTDQISLRVSESVGRHLTDRIGEADLKPVLRQIGNHALSELLQNPMIAIFLNDAVLDSIYERLEESIKDYVRENGAELIEPLVENEVNEICEKPVKDMFCSLNVDRELLEHMISRFIDERLESIVNAALQAMDIRGVIQHKIEKMDVAELEDLVMSVMKNELQAIVNLGALIGAVIGIINIFI